MANLAAAKQLIQRYGVQPPTGIAPGTPQYDEWAQAWLQAAVDAGDPEAVIASGGRRATDGYQGAISTDWANAAPASEWLGKRNPTPRELRRYARDAGWSEDFERFGDQQLAAWINDSWNMQGGYFTNDFGDRVEKPTESGANSQAAGYATGEGPQHGGGGRGGGGGGGGGPQAAAPQQNPAWTEAMGALQNPLQQGLVNLYSNRGGYFGEPNQADTTGGVSLNTGGIWWSDPGNPAGKPMAMPQTGGIDPAPNMPQTGGVEPAPAQRRPPSNPWQSYTPQPVAQPPEVTRQPRNVMTLPSPVQGPLETGLANGPYGGRRRDANDWWMPRQA